MVPVSGTINNEKAVVQVDTRRFVLGLIFSALSGILLLLSFPPYGLWPLAWVALVPALFAQYRLLPQRWSQLATALYALFWLGPFLARLFENEAGPFFKFLGIFIAILQLFLATERKFHESTHYRWFILFGVVGWVGFEMIRATFIPLIATSAFIGYTQASQAWLTQPVAVFSVYGLNLVLMFVNFTLAQGVIAWYDRKFQPEAVVLVDGRPTLRWFAITGVITVLWIGISLVMLGTAPKDSPTVRVAALQSGYPLPAFQDTVASAEVRFETFAQQARQAAQQGAEILFSSEMMFDFDPQQEFTQEFKDLAKETGAYIFITYAVAREGEPFRNQAVLLSPSGEFSEVYSKNHVPPGEPLSPGAGVYPVFETSLGILATLICHDANYTDVARKLASNGAQLIAAPYREFGGFGEQLWTNVTFRAVENHAAMVVTGASTVSAIIDPYGRQVALEYSQEDKQMTLIGDVPLGTGNTPYMYLGDWLGWISMAAFIFFIGFQIVLQRRAKKT
jgi:apolipoprotein N-acyltransferase